MNGLIIQWGTITQSGEQRFPVDFTKKPFMSCCSHSNADGGIDYDELPTVVDNTKYKLSYHYADVDYIAIGY